MFSTSWKLVASAARAGLSVWKSELLGTTTCPPWTGGSISPYASLIACLASSLVRDRVPGSVPTPIPPAAGVASWALPRRGKRAADKPRAPARNKKWRRSTEVRSSSCNSRARSRSSSPFGSRSFIETLLLSPTRLVRGRYRRHLRGGKWLRPLNHNEEYHQPRPFFEIVCTSFTVPSRFQESVSTVADRLPHNAGWSATHSLRTAPWASHHSRRLTRGVLWRFETGSMRQWPTQCGRSTTNWPRATI